MMTLIFGFGGEVTFGAELLVSIIHASSKSTDVI